MDEVAQFLDALVECGRSPATAKAYRTDLSGLVNFLEEQGCLRDPSIKPGNRTNGTAHPVNGMKQPKWFESRFQTVKQDHLLAYMARQKQQGMGLPTINRRVSAFRMFFGYLKNEGLISKSPANLLRTLPMPRSADKPGRALTAQQERHLLNLMSKRLPLIEQRDYVIVQLILATGLTSTEVMEMDMKSIDVTNKNGYTDLTVTVKGRLGKKRSVSVFDNKPLCEGLLLWLSEIRPSLHTGKSNAMFINSAGNSPRRQDLAQRMVQYRIPIGVPELTPTVLRNTYAAKALASGEHENKVAESMGLISSRHISNISVDELVRT